MNNAKNIHRQKLLIVGLVLLAVVLVIASLFAGIKLANKDKTATTQPNNIETVAKSASFKVAVPKSIPNGYTIDSAGASYENNIFIYSIKTPSGKSLTVTQQAKPSNINGSSFSGLLVKTGLGKAYVFTGPANTSATVLTDADNLITANSNSPIPETEVKTILNSLAY